MSYWSSNLITLYLGDARELPISDSSVDCVVTSPPYWGIRDYGIDGGIGLEATMEEHCQNIVTVFREVRRVLKPTGTVWVNIGDSYATSGSGGKAQSNNAPSSTEVNQKNYGRFQQGARYADQDRRKTAIGTIKEKDLIGNPWRVAFALQADGWYLRSDIIWSKPNPMPESVTDRPTKAHEYMFLLSKNPRYYYDTDAIRVPQLSEPSGRMGGGLKGSKHGMDQWGKDPDSKRDWNPLGRNKYTVWEIATQPYPEAHFATYPEKLVEPCILAGCPPDGVVLDPFSGSGTTAAVAQRLGRKAIGVDASKEYLDLSIKRLEKISIPLFSM